MNINTGFKDIKGRYIQLGDTLQYPIWQYDVDTGERSKGEVVLTNTGFAVTNDDLNLLSLEMKGAKWEILPKETCE